MAKGSGRVAFASPLAILLMAEASSVSFSLRFFPILILLGQMGLRPQL